jgi:hypothetical protein
MVDIELNGNFYTGLYQNNITSNPQFIAPSTNSGIGYNGVLANWSLQNSSPCINSGDPNGTYLPTDLAGNPRIYGGTVDIGAYEYQGPSAITEFNSQPKFSIFPNPSKGKFNIQMQGVKSNIVNLEIEIYNVLGEKVLKLSDFQTQNSNEIDFSEHSKGIYFIKINSGAKVHTEKIVIQ